MQLQGFLGCLHMPAAVVVGCGALGCGVVGSARHLVECLLAALVEAAVQLVLPEECHLQVRMQERKKSVNHKFVLCVRSHLLPVL